MGMPASRIMDMHVCPAVAPGPVPHVGGPLTSGEKSVTIGFIPASRVGDSCICACAIDKVAKGSRSVTIGGKPAARKGDPTTHQGKIVSGSWKVTIGG